MDSAIPATPLGFTAVQNPNIAGKRQELFSRPQYRLTMFP
jgi:hypothetical protein